MMKNIIQILMVLPLMLLMACGGGDPEDKLLHEAGDIHIEALNIKKEMEPNLKRLRSINNNIQVQGRALTLEEQKFNKEVAALESRLRYWEENHIEVPGFEHGEHDHSGHSHNHDHSHEPKFHLPASDMLIIQKEFRDSIIAIKGRLGSILATAPK